MGQSEGKGDEIGSDTIQAQGDEGVRVAGELVRKPIIPLGPGGAETAELANVPIQLDVHTAQ